MSPSVSMSRYQFLLMQEELIKGYKSEDFQRKLHAGWHSTREQVEKMTWKNSVCLEVQGPVIAKFGFEASRKGISHTLRIYFQNFAQDPDIIRRNEVMAWLVDPDLQAMEPDGPGGSMSEEGPPRGAVNSYAKEVHASAFGGKCPVSPFTGAWHFDDRPEEKFQIFPANLGHLRMEQQLTEDVLGRALFHPIGDIAYAELKVPEWDVVVTVMRLRMVDPGHMVISYREQVDPESWSPDRPANKECSFRVRITSLDDVAAMAGVDRVQGSLAGAHQALYKPIYPLLQQEQWFRVLGCDSIQEELECGVLILHAETSDGKVVGYISCSCTYGPSGVGTATLDGLSDDDRPHAKVNHIAVLPDWQGQGIGKLLFQELLDHLGVASPSVLGDLRLKVVDRNEHARAWYERLGFVERQRCDFDNGVCSVVFVEMQRLAEPAGDAA